MNTRLLALASLAAASALVLSGCSNAAAPQDTPTPTETDTASEAPDLGVAWLAGGNAIALETFGSGSRDCYPNIGGFGVNGNEITVRIDPLPADQICTMDYRAQLSLIDLEASISELNTKKDVVVKVEYSDAGKTFEAGVLPAITVDAAQKTAPSAGWIDQNLIALLTYGTGTVDCWPIFAGTTAPNAAQGVLDVAFESSTHTGACTADFRPQLHEVYVEDGLVDPALINELVLNGAGFENEKVSVAPAKF